MRYGKMEFGVPSRFLRDIDTRYLSLPQDMRIGRDIDRQAERFRQHIMPDDTFVKERSSLRATMQPPMSRRLKRMDTASSTFPTPQATGGLRAGQIIEHERFGRGEVLCVEGTDENAKATIRFQHAGDKQLLLRFARFKIIE